MGQSAAHSGRYLAAGFAALCLQWTSCTVEEIDLTGKECPCADGWICDSDMGRCVPVSGSKGGGGGSDSGADAKLDAQPDQSVDAPGDGSGGSVSVVLGRACIGSQRSSSMSANRKRVSRFSLFSAETYDAAMFYLDPPTGAGTTQQVRGVVYSVGGNGQPDALVGTTTEASIPSDFTPGWVSMVFPSPLPLEPGEYWVGAHSGPSGSAQYAFESAPAGVRFSDDAYSDGASATFGTASNGDYLLSVYLKPVGATVDDQKPCPAGTGGSGGAGGGGGTGAKGGTGGTGATGGSGGTGGKGGTGGTSTGGSGGTSTGGTSTGGSGGVSTGGTGGTSTGGSGGTSTGGTSGTGASGGTTGTGGTGGAADASVD